MKKMVVRLIACFMSCSMMAAMPLTASASHISHSEDLEKTSVQTVLSGEAAIETGYMEINLHKTIKDIYQFAAVPGTYNSYDEIIAAGAYVCEYFFTENNTIYLKFGDEYTVWVQYEDLSTSIHHVTVEGISPTYDNSGEPIVQYASRGKIVIDNNNTLIRDYTYAKGSYNDLQSLNCASGVKQVSYSSDTNAFYVIEEGDYTVCFTLWDGSVVLKHISVQMAQQDMIDALVDRVFASPDYYYIYSYEYRLSEDGGEFYPHTSWVTNDEYDALIQAFERVHFDILDHYETASREDIIEVYNYYDNAVKVFETAMKPGTGENYTVTKQGGTIIIDLKSDKAYEYLYMKGRYCEEYLYHLKYNYPEYVNVEEVTGSTININVDEPGYYSIYAAMYDNQKIEILVEVTEEDLAGM